ncbi:divergent PAP2 family protein [Bacillus cytotoxicus]|uniref:Acid phosphatase/vanadium-dependent haloperoxidase related n=2 Tax=Bacillus cytotoxicus TaxID=580165 RepID=A0AAX2CI10_9BACI|nr:MULTISPECIES: divergent PAP2 family protein [Bacillus cereus group]ABS22482.1 acid phosphatase/vanadium-dependent haloperoxidase related [Bacillus cytotoxicus NVH 391-98]AWC29139.1 divergent PAP2 family protein [Bacillus cytotoxicus]AWC33126.1 divergent PAP2 family protein [Bacillus cytotoxicus]AWC37153.1 divergent PAP2 family protein [Bacillus cytotoxicus]AWC39475.1 divergent PAP2 family protein [Bacillus cytotoxicus]
METILHNEPFMAAVLSWFLAQFTKVIFKLAKTREFDFAQFFASGGMPSSHSSTVTALATGVGIVEGISSAVFAVAVIFAIIVMYDASGVRLAVSKQAKILNDFFHGRQTNYKKLNELVGHTPYQVVVGAILGVVVGIWYCM